MSTLKEGKTLTPEQCRAARALLGWSQSDLGEKASVARKTLADFEGGKKKRPYARTLADVRAALEAAGVEFTNGDAPGVRIKKRGG